jgi:peroxiredoxin
MTNTPDLAIGTLAPEFSLPSTNGSNIALADYRTKSKVYLFFVREYN